MHHIRRGTGKPLLLIHGLGGHWQSWNPILADLATRREVIAVDLPGFGQTPRLAGETSIRTLADETAAFLHANGLSGIDAVGSSMGARLVLELARRGGSVGGVVALNPGGFWQGWERHAFFSSIYLSIRLLRLLRPVLPAICANPLGRALLLAQFSARPTRLAPDTVSDELCSYVASPAFDELLAELAYGEEQQGAPRNSIAHPLVIGWGRRDRVCFPRQAARALALFPDAQLHWFDRCGHFPHWDAPAQTVELILSALAGARTDAAAGLSHEHHAQRRTEQRGKIGALGPSLIHAKDNQ
ncbi:alpha/beta fold hydrolase [Massilia puerhi]|uniref:alpha/beta fold hydrolase n=1 Tax=Massilia puerhi TaxID=2681550 RepID=UPI00135AE74A|nr:alpha/beta fold hydrolase [Massilia puerhi]